MSICYDILLIKLYFNSFGHPSTVTVSMPARIGVPPVVLSMAAHSTDSLDLTALLDSVENRPANTVNRAGILIQATKDIAAYYMVKASGNKEKVDTFIDRRAIHRLRPHPPRS